MRPSPSESATLYKVGAKKTGNDGNIWIVAENKNGIKKWKQNKKQLDNPKKVSIKAKRKSKLLDKVPNKINKASGDKNKIRFCGVGSGIFGSRGAYIDIIVNADFIKALSKPKEIKCQQTNTMFGGNIFVFGKKFYAFEYKKLGTIGLDVGTVMLLNMNGITRNELTNINEIDLGDNNLKNLKKYQKEVSESILFIGDTIGNNDIDLLAHYDDDNNINGLIIDNCWTIAKRKL